MTSHEETVYHFTHKCTACLGAISFEELSAYRRATGDMHNNDYSKWRADLSSRVENAMTLKDQHGELENTRQHCKLALTASVRVGPKTAVCRECFCFLHHSTTRMLEVIVKEIKTSMLHADARVRLTAAAPKAKHGSRYTALYRNVHEAEKAMNPPGTPADQLLSHEQLQLLTFASTPAMEALHAYLADYFNAVGCYQPSTYSNQLLLSDSFSFKAVYDEMVHEFRLAKKHEPLGFSAFRHFWRATWGHVTIRGYKEVESKCSICDHLSQLNLCATTDKDRDTVKMYVKLILAQPLSLTTNTMAEIDSFFQESKCILRNTSACTHTVSILSLLPHTHNTLVHTHIHLLHTHTHTKFEGAALRWYETRSYDYGGGGDVGFVAPR